MADLWNLLVVAFLIIWPIAMTRQARASRARAAAPFPPLAKLKPVTKKSLRRQSLEEWDREYAELVARHRDQA